MLYLSGEPDVSVHGLHVPVEDPTFRFFNPSVAVVGERTCISLRALNVERSDVSGRFYLLPPHREIESRILIGEHDAGLACAAQFQVDIRDPQTGQAQIGGGYEDTRIIASPEDALVGIACTPGPERRVRPDGEVTFDPKFRMRISRLDFGPKYQLTRVTTYESPFDRLREKNWAPFFHEDRLLVVYQWNPLVVMELLPGGGTRFVHWSRTSPQLAHLRGGSPGIATKDGYLFVVHRRFHLGNKLRFTHQFIGLGRDLLPRRVSPEFCFLSTALLEYGSGLARVGDRLVVTFGLGDVMAFALRVPEASVERWLRPFDQPVAANPAMLAASLAEQQDDASADFPKDPDLGPLRLAKLGARDWFDRTFRPGRVG